MKIEEWEQLRGNIIYEVTKLGVCNWQIESVESTRKDGKVSIYLRVIDTDTYGPVSRTTLQVDKDILFISEKEANLYYYTNKKKELEKELQETEKELKKWSDKDGNKK